MLNSDTYCTACEPRLPPTHLHPHTAAAPSKAPPWSSARPAGIVTMSACPRPSPSVSADTTAPRARTWPRNSCARPARSVRSAPIARCPRARSAITVRWLGSFGLTHPVCFDLFFWAALRDFFLLDSRIHHSFGYFVLLVFLCLFSLLCRRNQFYFSRGHAFWSKFFSCLFCLN